MRREGEHPLHIYSATRKIIRGLVWSNGKLGPLLRGLLNSPAGVEDMKRSSATPYPLPLLAECRDAIRHFAETSSCSRRRNGTDDELQQQQQDGLSKKDLMHACPAAWCGLLVIGLNTSLGLTTEVVDAVRSPLKRSALECFWEDAKRFVDGDGLSGDFVVRPEVPWSRRLPEISIGYGGDVVEKARWLTWDQVAPGLPPVGKGGLLFAPDFCDDWVARHLLDAELSRLDDSQTPCPLPHAVCRCTQSEWDKIACELVKRGVAAVIDESDIAVSNGEMILNGAFGVTKPNKWVGDPEDGIPVLRFIMDFRAANAAHRMLPGAVSSLVGASKWQGFCLGDGEVLLSSGDDLVSAFYLFRLPWSWSRYFTFRKRVRRSALGLLDNPDSFTYITSRVLPMGWSAAVTVMQHMHRSVALNGPVLPPSREIRRDDGLPQKETSGASVFWNLYVDDLTIMEIVSEDWMNGFYDGDLGVSDLQKNMESAYVRLGVPYSADKAESRRVECEKLGAFIDGGKGILGITTARALDFLTLCFYIMSQEKATTKWFQVVMGKYVHMVQFRRPLFSLPKVSWDRISRFNSGGPLTMTELDEWFTLCMTLPLAYTNLKAKVSGCVTCSDASPTGGGLCVSRGLTPLGCLGSVERPLTARARGPQFLTIEWFAGIGGMSRALERLGVRTFACAVCECDEDCLAILRQYLPGVVVWKDIKMVSEGDIISLPIRISKG